MQLTDRQISRDDIQCHKKDRRIRRILKDKGGDNGLYDNRRYDTKYAKLLSQQK